MTNKSLVLSHGDLDGCVGAMVCKKYITQLEGNDHEVLCSPCSYETINDMASEAFQNAKDYKHILVVDICFNEELLKIKPDNCRVFDHHDTSRFIIGKKDCHWEEKYCGAVVAWKYLFPGVKMTKQFNRLMGLANEYDMWIGAKGPRKICHDLNVIYNHYKYSDFFDKFYDGFECFSGEENDYLTSYWNKQEEILADTTKVEYGKDVVFLMVSDERLDCNYWCNHFLHEYKYNVIITVRPHKNRLSMRSSDRIDFHSGFWLRDNIKNSNNSKGGHRKAGGCSVEGMTEDEILEIGSKIQALLDSKKEVANEAR
jgi:oligoribonuclease NrnB/cAMP/cGMP phosphodiesterase (DHH superfamily)